MDIDASKSVQTTSAKMGIEIGLIISFIFPSAPVIGVLNNRWNQTRLFLLIGAMLKSCAVVLLAFVTTNAVAFILFALMGIGASIMWMTCLKELNRLAGENFKLLYSISTCGYPVGMILVPLLATALIDVYSWRDVLLFIGALTTHLIPCGMTIKASMDPRDHAQYDGGDGRSQSDSTSEMGLNQRFHGSEDRFDQDSLPRLDIDDSENGDAHQCSQTKQDLTRSYLKITPIDDYDDDDDDDERSTKCSNLQSNGLTRRLVEWWRSTEFYSKPLLAFVILSYCMLEFIYTGWHAFLLPKALQRTSERNTVFIALSAAIGNLSGRISSGVLTNRLFDPTNMYLILSVINVAALACDGFLPYYFVSLMMSYFSGLSIAGRAVLGPLVIKSTVSNENVPLIIGVLYFVSGFGAFLGGFSAGLIADCLSSYDATFKILAIVDILTFIFMAVPKIFGRNLLTGKV
ncbi:uncharacterized protein LOC135155803 [Lytechinus pictus]|uniref:uncharacterized protein LOC135155803 n=1 Tax=Lytechinus pictus TaxID=7653 RepID=UPI0030BA0AD1